MTYLPEEMWQPPAVRPKTIRISRPYWMKVGESEVCVVIDHPGNPGEAGKLEFLTFVLTRSRGGDTLGLLKTPIYPELDSGYRRVVCSDFSIGSNPERRDALKSPLRMDIELFEQDGMGRHRESLASAAYTVDPVLSQLRLVHMRFLPERPGMAMRFREVEADTLGRRESFHVRKLVRIDFLTREGSCPGGRTVLLEYLSCRTSGGGGDIAGSPCSGSLPEVLADSRTVWFKEEESLCEDYHIKDVDSSSLYAYPRSAFFGAERYLDQRSQNWHGGFHSFRAFATGLGETSSLSTSGVTNSSISREMIEVHFP